MSHKFVTSKRGFTANLYQPVRPLSFGTAVVSTSQGWPSLFSVSLMSSRRNPRITRLNQGPQSGALGAKVHLA